MITLIKNATAVEFEPSSVKEGVDIIIEDTLIKEVGKNLGGKYKTDKEGTRRNFLIAQDLLKVFPEVVDVDENKEKPMGIRYQDLIPVLLKAIQELSLEINQLKAK